MSLINVNSNVLFLSFSCPCHYFIFTGKTSEVVPLNSFQVKFFITLFLLCVGVDMSLCVRSNCLNDNFFFSLGWPHNKRGRPSRWRPSGCRESSSNAVSTVSSSSRILLRFSFSFFKCSLVSIIVLLFYPLVFRSSVVNGSLIPSLASQENEKHSSMMSFVVQCRCLVSTILMSEQSAVNVCVFTKKIDERSCDISLLLLTQAAESEEQSHNDRSNCWPVYPVKIHKEQVIKWSTSKGMDRTRLLNVLCSRLTV